MILAPVLLIGSVVLSYAAALGVSALVFNHLFGFPGADPVLTPEMKSTGEVMGIDRDFATAFLKSQMGAGDTLPEAGTLFVSVKDGDKAAIVPAVRGLLERGFSAVATGGTQKFLAEQGLAVERVNKVAEGQPHIVDRIIDGDIALIRKSEAADTGDIVVALIDDEEATLKRFRRRGASIALEPANTAYEVRILPPNRVRIQGKLVGLFRRY